MQKRGIKNFIILGLMVLIVTACASPTGSTGSTAGGEKGKVSVVATTTIVGDVVRQIGGDRINLTVLMPVDTDPHTYEPTPKDMAKTADAGVIFVNGLGLEGFIETMVKNSSGGLKVISVSDGVSPREFSASEQALENPDAGTAKSYDPHVWVDPNNVKVWVENIRKALTQIDAGGSEVYQKNADAYLQQLDELDQWIQAQTATVPEANRKIVTDHVQMGYFAERYGYDQIGAIIPSYSTVSQPSAQEIAKLEDTIRNLKVKAVFVGENANPTLAKRIADDTGVQLVYFYTGSLSKVGGPAATYLDYMRYDTSVITKALK
jgi:ABC-type Zn uptake system ZnuABC Zn-binding protein ZnuA